MKFGTVLLMIALVSFVGSVWGQEPTIDDLKKDNQQLKQEIIRLKKQIVKLQDVENRAKRDQAANDVMAAVSIYFAESLAAGEATWPKSITKDMFDDGNVPKSDFGGYTWSYDSSTHAVTTN